MTTEYTAARTSIRTAAIMVLFTIVFTALMAGTYTLTKATIDASALETRMKLVNEVLPPESYDNVLLDDYVEAGATPALGPGAGNRIYRARKAGQPAGLVIEAIAPDGYSGNIALIIGVDAEWRVGGVRVVTHKETPGLGDYIDPRKDKNKAQPWIGGFNTLVWAEVGAAGWKVRKDGGRFDYHTGATISARAVTNAVGRALAWAEQNRGAILQSASGSRI